MGCVKESLVYFIWRELLPEFGAVLRAGVALWGSEQMKQDPTCQSGSSFRILLTTG